MKKLFFSNLVFFNLSRLSSGFRFAQQSFPIIIGISLCSTIFNFQLQAQHDPRALEILEKMSAKYSSIKAFKAQISYFMESPATGITQNEQWEITVKGDKYKLVMGEQEIFNNGKTIWNYLKEANEVNISDYEPEENEITPTEIYTMYKKGYKYWLMEEKTMAGKVYHVVDLTPENRDQQVFKVRILISIKDNLILSWKIFEKNGNRYLYTIKKFTPNINVEDNYFVFDKSKYKGVEVIDLR
ncbi:MAG: outer membrane lipoprotein carrier protein LolA [Bacteroidetes bacterium]|nr:outer membrane lipoprotein carrier protein LolA [Bacteroidota bacterium]